MILPNDMYGDIGINLGFDLEKKFFATTAGEIMRKHDVNCSPDDSLMDAALILAGAEVNEMPVLNKNGKVVGIITEGILLRHLE
jgi:CBS domain-containing protein